VTWRDVRHHAIKAEAKEEVGAVAGEEIVDLRLLTHIGLCVSEASLGFGALSDIARNDDELGDLVGRRIDDRVHRGFQRHPASFCMEGTVAENLRGTRLQRGAPSGVDDSMVVDMDLSQRAFALACVTREAHHTARGG